MDMGTLTRTRTWTRTWTQIRVVQRFVLVNGHGHIDTDTDTGHGHGHGGHGHVLNLQILTREFVLVLESFHPRLAFSFLIFLMPVFRRLVALSLLVCLFD